MKDYRPVLDLLETEIAIKFVKDTFERELAAALDEVSDEHRRIVLLRDVSGMSYTEIAEILEVSEGTVKSRLSRARIALRKILLKRGNLFHLPSSKDMEGGEEHE